MAYGVSADGSVVVGAADYGAAGDGRGHYPMRAFRWTQATGMASLDALNGGSNSAAFGISADGSVVVGYSGEYAFRWTQATGMVSLGGLNGGRGSVAIGASADGSAVVGGAGGVDDGSGNHLSRAFRWTQATGMVSLGVLDGGSVSTARRVSADGSVVVGGSDASGTGGDWSAFRWTQASGMTNLGGLNGGSTSFANGVSSDGNVIVGYATDGAAGNLHRAFRWTQATGMVSLGVLNGGSESTAGDVSADGTVVVGTAYDGNANNAPRATRWTQQGGMQTVEQWLRAAGVTVAQDFRTSTALATNADGSVVVGRLDNYHAFIARVTSQGSGSIDYPAYLGTVATAARTSLLGSRQADMTLHGLRGSPIQNLPATGQQTAWVAGDVGRGDHLADESNIASGEVGYAWGLTDRFAVKIALGQTYGTQSLGYGGNASLRGTYAVPELVYHLPESRVYATVSGYYNDGETDVRRGYLNAGSPVQSVGEADMRVAALRLRVDAVDALNVGKAAISPYASLTYIHSRRNAYTEVGGGFPVQWDALTSITTQGRLGAESRYPLSEQVSLLGNMEMVYRVESADSRGTGQVLGLSRFDAGNVAYQRAWLRAAAGVEARVGTGTLTFMLNGTTAGNVNTLWAYANYRVPF